MNFGRNVVGWIAVTTTVSLGLFAAMGTQGCTVTTGPIADDDGGFGFDTSTPDSGTDSAVHEDPCAVCLAPYCAPQHAVCLQNADCQKIYACTSAPACAADASCVQACFDADGGTTLGKQIYIAFASCDQSGQCFGGPCAAACNPSADECAVEDAGQPDTSPPVDAAPGTDAAPAPDAAPPATCDQCITDSCSGEKARCAAGSDCAAYQACVDPCATAECIAACGTAHATGLSDNATLATCSTTNCKTPCGY